MIGSRRPKCTVRRFAGVLRKRLIPSHQNGIPVDSGRRDIYMSSRPYNCTGGTGGRSGPRPASRKKNMPEIIRAKATPLKKKKSAPVSGCAQRRKRPLAVHAVPQRARLSNSIFRLRESVRWWRKRGCVQCDRRFRRNGGELAGDVRITISRLWL